MDNILVSICCTTYNHERYIVEAIESFLAQRTDFQYEIVIGEDYSQDLTRSIVEMYTRHHSDKVRLITSETNVGQRKNIYRVHEAARGKYIALCDGDDYWSDPDKLQKQVDFMETNPDCSLCFHAVDVIDRLGTVIRQDRPYTESRVSPIEDIISKGGLFCPTASLVYPRAYMIDPPEFWWASHVGDYPLQLLLASKGFAYYMDESMSVYRTGVEGSWTSRTLGGVDGTKRFIKILEGDNVLLEDFDRFTNHQNAEIINKTRMTNELQIALLQVAAGQQ